ncbi:uncharacterized protein BO80DRAFT_259000 [Aspergillus ibericus CBS 121593]|uniref:Uncharacterized protein n=1 Tax=Aspergillus ibericus CBS 121593 TaxID=1448316 RepID=A0A395HBC1_9EURO|nr:hypothetical protein BO80DRAFT_259000 [Aspergillus ibericus CBS 121593]RAL04228.1 hypothetical protein BO80DRAFT_259000 [Aspergillus ibericus CBS 121593]
MDLVQYSGGLVILELSFFFFSFSIILVIIILVTILEVLVLPVQRRTRSFPCCDREPLNGRGSCSYGDTSERTALLPPSTPSIPSVIQPPSPASLFLTTTICSLQFPIILFPPFPKDTTVVLPFPGVNVPTVVLISN